MAIGAVPTLFQCGNDNTLSTCWRRSRRSRRRCRESPGRQWCVNCYKIADNITVIADETKDFEERFGSGLHDKEGSANRDS